MRTTTREAALAVGILCAPWTGTVLADHGGGHDGGGLESCLRAASKIKSGPFVKVESLPMVLGAEAAYEIEIRDSAGVEWELMCEADDARIYEIEREADSASDELFSRTAKVSEADATQTVLTMYPGKVEEVEFEIEADGSATYEIDVVTADGKEMKIEVDAATGKIIEVAAESWEIGAEPDEKR